MLAIELIAAKTRRLVSRMFASVKAIQTDPDKIWKTADSFLRNASSDPAPNFLRAAI